MAVQFAGSGSTGDRRRRRIVVNGEGADIDPSLVGAEAADIESQLVASAAAGPWVPVSELRIWIYASFIAILVGLIVYATVQPLTYRAEVRPLTELLFNRSQPMILVVMEVLFLGLSALLGHLIGWYRSRGKLDFAGRYRFWPWASVLFGASAFCLATGTHQAVGQIIANLNFVPWRPATVGWLLPVSVAALPISLYLDRDVRHRRSCLWTIRTSVALWISEALLEIYRPELQSQSWFALAHTLIPVFAGMTLFLGLWLHARVVAYICPDPPELNERSAWSLLLTVGIWTLGAVAFWRRQKSTEAEAEEAAPKRRRKKADTEEATTKRKRKTPAKKPTSRSRTRTKPVEEEAEEEEAENESSGDAENESVNEAGEESSSDAVENVSEDQQDAEQWEEEAAEEESRQDSRGKDRYNQVHRSHGSAAPAPHSRRQASTWEDESGYEESPRSSAQDSSADSDDDDQSDDGGSKIDAEQLKGLSKRQKRELRKQLREQERARGR